MAKVRVVNNNLDSNLNGNYFNNTASEIIFSFGSFSVTSNFDGRKYIDYTNQLSSFAVPITLETIGLTDTQSQIIYEYTTNAILNLDKSDLNTFIRFGSAYEFLRVCIQNIIITYPGSLFVSSQAVRSGNVTYTNYVYDPVSNVATFQVPIGGIVNTFGLVYNYGNTSAPDNNELKNLNTSYNKYIVWTSQFPEDYTFTVVGFTGNTSSRKYLILKVRGNPFSGITGTSAPIDFHIRPNTFVFEEFRAVLNEYEKYIVSQREGVSGFRFTLKDPTLLDDGTITYSDTTLLWSTGDKYNIDINTPNYQKFLNILLTIGSKYDTIKTDLIARFLTPASLKTYDLTEEGKMTKLLRIYGREFDQLREFIDSLVYINKVTYDKINNVPDQLIKNLSRVFGWDYFSLVNETELVDSVLTIDASERNLNTDLLPAEIDIELWRRILINTSYFWKTKGTREAIKSIFLLIGIPEPFINITEYVYTVDGKINPETVPFTAIDFPSNSLPYDTEGYPVAPVETNDFYFQISGDTDSGQAYMNVFRKAGFNLIQTVDNKKSWIQTGATTRIDDTTPQYYQQDSKLVLNTKEVDIALDTARGIEYDIYEYIKYQDFPANSSRYTLPYSYINISLGFTGAQNVFTLPYSLDEIRGDFEVRYNGVLLNAPKTGSTGGTGSSLTGADYSISGNTFTLLTASAYSNTYRRDVIQATLITSGGTSPVSGITVKYMVARVKANLTGTTIPLPSMPRGDVQVTINGIALTKGTPQFTADYIVDPSNTTGYSQIIISNSDLISFLAVTPDVQVTYVEVIGSNDISARNEVVRIDSFSSSKIYYNSSMNKYVYKLNYRANNASDLKILIDGMALEPNTDYSINVSNPYEVFLPRGLHYGSVISVYYLIANATYFNPVVPDAFGVGDISQLSFLEFIELLQRRLINVRNRKTITDFKGGWYPTLLNIYIQYLKRAELDPENPLLSNGYTFANLYSFLSKYNAFFQRFVDQLLSPTIILKNSGLLIRNTVFTKQKFAYKQGVNLFSCTCNTLDFRGNPMIQYFGNAGSEFVIGQPTIPLPPEPPTLYVETIPGTLGSIITGGRNIVGYELVNEYGIVYRKYCDNYPYTCSTAIGLGNLGIFDENVWSSWYKNSTCGSLSTDNYSRTLTGLVCGTLYEYAAFIKACGYGYTGNSLQIRTPEPPLPPSLCTCVGTTSISSISSTGGIVSPSCYGCDVEWYGMQYRAIGTVGEFGDLTLSPTALTYTSAGGTQNIIICGKSSNSYSISNPISSWAHTEVPEPPTPTGVLHGITVDANVGSARSGLICYDPTFGTTKCVCITQQAAATSNAVCIYICDRGVYSACGCFKTQAPMSTGQCYFATIGYTLSKLSSVSAGGAKVCVTCNNVKVYCCERVGRSFYATGQFTVPINICVDCNDVIRVYTEVSPAIGTDTITASMNISSITSGVGSFCRSSVDYTIISASGLA